MFALQMYNNGKYTASIVVKETCSAEVEVERHCHSETGAIEKMHFDIVLRLVSLVATFHPCRFSPLLFFPLFCSLSSAASLQAVILSTSG